ncbi:MAG: NUDIX domain-containing protein [archaeon]|jgi:predicted house-cleaning noncanonical NTP pyrophosphatase (MazG superfamily)/8-oxo-dGTP pyrophosphatase MutT (NUDIX family)
METYDFSKPIHYTATVFVIHEKKLLLLKQDKSSFWLLPGGHIEDNELPHEAAVREVLEETGLTIELLQKPDENARTKIATPLPIPITLQLLPCRDKKDISFYYTAKVVSGEVKIDSESTSAKWFTLKEILNTPEVGPNTKYYARKLLEETKLVRDNIPKIMLSVGKQPITHIANEKEYKEYLLKKLDEEVLEVKNDLNEEELADALEVIYALAETIGKTPQNLENLRKLKKEKNGGFEKKIILENHLK